MTLLKATGSRDKTPRMGLGTEPVLGHGLDAFGHVYEIETWYLCGISDTGSRRGIGVLGPHWERQAPTCKPQLAGISGCVALTFRAVTRYLAARPPGPRGWLSPTLADRKGGLQDSGVGMDRQTDGRARTPPATVLLPPEPRKASF